MCEIFKDLYAVNVNEYTETKDGMTYLTWSSAWAEVMKRYHCDYEIEKFNGLPYVYDENTGYMVYTKVTIEGVTREMWLPVMDSKNKAMLAHSYEYQTKYGVKTVEPATMTDINKTIMRCLVKNLAMFGLGLYIYAGEDLPEGEQTEAPAKEPEKKPKKAPAKKDSKPALMNAEQKVELLKEVNRVRYPMEQLLAWAKVANIDDVSAEVCEYIVAKLRTFPSAED